MTWTAAADVGGGPYPGRRPAGSWILHADGRVQAGNADTSGRQLVIAYGSNADPLKLLDQPRLFEDGDVIAVQATIVDWSAAWCDARRTRDGSVVATLVPTPGRDEVHPLLALTPAQLALVDAWEGHPTRYRRVRHPGRVVRDDGVSAPGVDVYLGTPDVRPVLLRDGVPLLCADVPYALVDALVPR